jgi:hypothetical protein
MTMVKEDGNLGMIECLTKVLTTALSGQASPILARLFFYSYSFICKQFQHAGACRLCARSLYGLIISAILIEYKKSLDE